MLLSIIIISHNQKEQLRRCVESVLAQSLPFEHEIILSDDRSTDGTWELAQEYAKRYQEISAYRCNTDDYHSSNNSERGSWNRCNGYKYAKGKYIAHIDGDDFLRAGTDIYKKQVELLERYPMCSCCMANDYTLIDGEEYSMATLLHKDVFETGQILSPEEYIKNYFRESHCFVYRRNEDANPIELYGGYYEDALLTAHYLQFGDIVCLKDAGYIYVQYSTSIMGRFSKNKKDGLVLCCPALYIPFFIPKWKNAFMSGSMHLKGMWNVVRVLLAHHRLQEENRLWITKMKSKSYLYKCFECGIKNTDYPRLLFLFVYLAFLYKVHPKVQLFYQILCKFMS